VEITIFASAEANRIGAEAKLKENQMKRVLFALSLLVLSSVPLLAQDNPFVGIWKLNLAKSKFEPGPAPKSQTRTVCQDGALTLMESAADGTHSYSYCQYTGRITRRLTVAVNAPSGATPSHYMLVGTPSSSDSWVRVRVRISILQD